MLCSGLAFSGCASLELGFSCAKKKSYTHHIVFKSVLDTLFSVKKCLMDSLSVRSEVAGVLQACAVLQAIVLAALAVGGLLVAEVRAGRLDGPVTRCHGTNG